MTVYYPEAPSAVREPVGERILSSRQLLDDYFELRKQTAELPKLDGEELAGVQEGVRQWLASQYPDNDAPGDRQAYRTYSASIVQEKIGGLADFLSENYPGKINPLEFTTTRAFNEATFAMWDDASRPEEMLDRDGSFAFVVPARMSRDNPEYGAEVEPVIPLLRYVPNELRAWMMREYPPFVIDTYTPDASGRRGYLVYAPVSGDMQRDLGARSTGEYISAVREAVNDAVDFAVDRLGVRVAGLGATLPGGTNYGKSIARPDVITTTGHGGTVRLICETIEEFAGQDPRVGVIGLGHIGAAAAAIAASTFSGAPISVYDTVGLERKVRTLEEAQPGRFETAPDRRSLVDRSDVIISAVTTRVGLADDGVASMEGKLVVDDSQPAMFDPAEVEGLNGSLVWVIGKDHSGRTRRVNGYDYGTMMDESGDLFGCEAEAMALAAYWAELESRGYSAELAGKVVARVAIRGPVTVRGAARIGELFRRYGIGVSDPQAFGVPASIRKQ